MMSDVVQCHALQSYSVEWQVCVLCGGSIVFEHLAKRAVARTSNRWVILRRLQPPYQQKWCVLCSLCARVAWQYMERYSDWIQDIYLCGRKRFSLDSHSLWKLEIIRDIYQRLVYKHGEEAEEDQLSVDIGAPVDEIHVARYVFVSG